MDLRGKVVLVTGASSGIGRQAALAFDRSGARVAMAARRADRLEENASRMTDAYIVTGDLAERGQAESMVDRTIEHFGRLDVLINNAGVTRVEHSDSMDLTECERIFEIHFYAAMLAARRALPQMRKQGGGHIVNVASPAGVLGVPFNSSYSASKGAMTGWTRAIQAEWAGTGILVTEYNPGLVASEMAEGGTAGEGIGSLTAEVPQPGMKHDPKRMKRMLTPEQVGADVVDCVLRERLTAYSTFELKMRMYLAELPAFRRAWGGEVRRSLCERLGIEPWS